MQKTIVANANVNGTKYSKTNAVATSQLAADAVPLLKDVIGTNSGKIDASSKIQLNVTAVTNAIPATITVVINATNAMIVVTKFVRQG